MLDQYRPEEKKNPTGSEVSKQRNPGKGKNNSPRTNPNQKKKNETKQKKEEIIYPTSQTPVRRPSANRDQRYDSAAWPSADARYP
ncbi:hypothetical protein I7I48_07027 [Histoplasma ohiense]|nr:hypothetical protein I7I48_07027 [Histoplasma ohiense (nom. inval.)]